MKKFLKSRLLAFILGAIIFGSVGVLASQIFARDISYGNTNVESALNDLYSKANEDIISKLSLTTSFEYSVGVRTGPKTMSINVGSGSYLIVFSSSYAWNSGSWNQDIVNNIEEVMSNNNCTPLITKKIQNYTDGNANFMGTAVYKCRFTNSSTVSFSHDHESATGMTENFLLYSIKLD